MTCMELREFSQLPVLISSEGKFEAPASVSHNQKRRLSQLHQQQDVQEHRGQGTS